MLRAQDEQCPLRPPTYCIFASTVLRDPYRVLEVPDGTFPGTDAERTPQKWQHTADSADTTDRRVSGAGLLDAIAVLVLPPLFKRRNALAVACPLVSIHSVAY